MKHIKLFEEFINESAKEYSSELDVIIDDYMMDDAETKIPSEEIIDTISNSKSEDDFLEFFYNKYGNNKFTTNDISSLLAYFHEVQYEKVKKEKEEEKSDKE